MNDTKIFQKGIEEGDSRFLNRQSTLKKQRMATGYRVSMVTVPASATSQSGETE